MDNQKPKVVDGTVIERREDGSVQVTEPGQQLVVHPAGSPEAQRWADVVPFGLWVVSTEAPAGQLKVQQYVSETVTAEMFNAHLREKPTTNSEERLTESDLDEIALYDGQGVPAALMVEEIRRTRALLRDLSAWLVPLKVKAEIPAPSGGGRPMAHQLVERCWYCGVDTLTDPCDPSCLRFRLEREVKG